MRLIISVLLSKTAHWDLSMKPNYAFAKRQRELAKKQKKEAKQRERAADKTPAEAPPGEASVPTQTENRGG
jgi:hypothetical protein